MTRPVRLHGKNSAPEFSTLNCLHDTRDRQKSTATLQSSIIILFCRSPNQNPQKQAQKQAGTHQHQQLQTTDGREILSATICPNIRIHRHFRGNVSSIPILRRSPTTSKIHRISTKAPFKMKRSQITKGGSPGVLTTDALKTRQPPMLKQTSRPIATIQRHEISKFIKGGGGGGSDIVYAMCV